MQAAEPIDRWVARPDTAPRCVNGCNWRSARAFAVTELGLPDNDSYRRYADLQRPAAVWNVVAAPPYALEPHRWCFPGDGLHGYRGYFNEADAQAEGAPGGPGTGGRGMAPAYSTLGYMNWAGGDPPPNTFIAWPEGEFVRLLFHEPAHPGGVRHGGHPVQRILCHGRERLGSAQWLATQATPQYPCFCRQRSAARQFRAPTRATRAHLLEILCIKSRSNAQPSSA